MPKISFQQLKRIAQHGVSIINGVAGDKLHNTSLGIEMGFYHQHKRLALDTNSLSERYASLNAVPSPKICILIHGVTDNETTWTMPDKSDYGSLLEQDFQYTPFYLRIMTSTVRHQAAHAVGNDAYFLYFNGIILI